jgi:hypothetical protein
VRVDVFDTGPAPSITVSITGNNPSNTQPVTAINQGIAVASVNFPSTTTTLTPNFGPEAVLTCAPITADDTPLPAAVFDIDVKEKAQELLSTLDEEKALSTVNGTVTGPMPTNPTQIVVTITGITPGLVIEYDGPVGPDQSPTLVLDPSVNGAKFTSTSLTQVFTFTIPVVKDNPTVIETADLQFSIFSKSGSATGVTIPGASTVTATVALGPVGSLASPATATASLTFAPNTQGKGTVANISDCITALLWPYVTNSPGFNTGITISNTSADTPAFPIGGALPLAGACTIYGWAGTGGTALGSFTTPSIPAGATWVTAISGIPAFSGMNGGYLIGVCPFQNGHGSAFLWSDAIALGSPDIASGYLALIIPNPAIVPRSPAGGGPGEGLLH